MKEMNGLGLQLEDKHIYRVGMTPELQEEVGDVEFAKIHPVGFIEVDEVLLSLEASKAAIEIPTSISGEIIEVNEAALQDFSLLNSNDTAKNWIARIKVD